MRVEYVFMCTYVLCVCVYVCVCVCVCVCVSVCALGLSNVWGGGAFFKLWGVSCGRNPRSLWEWSVPYQLLVVSSHEGATHWVLYLNCMLLFIFDDILDNTFRQYITSRIMQSFTK